MAEDTLYPADSEVTAPKWDSGDDTREESVDANNEGAESSSEETQDDREAKRVADTKAYLKETQRELHAAREQLAEMKGQIEALNSLKQKPAEEVSDWLEDEGIEDKYIEDPVGTTKELIRKARAEIADLIKLRDGAVMEEVQELLKYEPKKAQLAPIIQELSEKAWFKNLPDAAKIEAAEEIAKSRPKSAQSLKAPHASPGGSGRRVQDTKDSAEEKLAALRELAAKKFGPLKSEAKPLNLGMI